MQRQVDRTNEIKIPSQMQQFQTYDDGQRRQQQMQYDPNVNRKVRLQQLELQSELQRRDTEEQFRQMREREIGERDTRYMEAKRSQVIMQAQQMRNPERQNDYNNQPPQNDVFQQKPQNNPYQVKSYGLSSNQTLNLEIDHQNNLSSNQSQSDASKSKFIVTKFRL